MESLLLRTPKALVGILKREDRHEGDFGVLSIAYAWIVSPNFKRSRGSHGESNIANLSRTLLQTPISPKLC